MSLVFNEDLQYKPAFAAMHGPHSLKWSFFFFFFFFFFFWRQAKAITLLKIDAKCRVTTKLDIIYINSYAKFGWNS